MSDEFTDDELDALSQAMGDGDIPEDVANVVAEARAEPEKAAGEAPPPTPPPSPALDAAQGSQAAPAVQQISHAQFMQLDEVAAAADLPPQELERMSDVKVKVEVVLGESKKPLEEVLKLQPGTVVELDRLAGEPVDITANGQIFARAEVVVIDDNYGVKILDIVGTQSKLNMMQV